MALGSSLRVQIGQCLLPLLACFLCGPLQAQPANSLPLVSDAFLGRPVTVFELFLQNLEARALRYQEYIADSVSRGRWSSKWRPEKVSNIAMPPYTAVRFDALKQEITVSLSISITGVDDPWAQVCEGEARLMSSFMGLQKSSMNVKMLQLFGPIYFTDAKAVDAVTDRILERTTIVVSFNNSANNTYSACAIDAASGNFRVIDR